MSYLFVQSGTTYKCFNIYSRFYFADIDAYFLFQKNADNCLKEYIPEQVGIYFIDINLQSLFCFIRENEIRCRQIWRCFISKPIKLSTYMNHPYDPYFYNVSNVSYCVTHRGLTGFSKRNIDTKKVFFSLGNPICLPYRKQIECSAKVCWKVYPI